MTQPPKKRPAGLRTRRFGAGLIAILVGVLGAYALLHSPLRPHIDRILHATTQCYALCNRQGILDAADQVSALLLIGAALMAAWALVEGLRLRGYERPLGFGLLMFAFISVPPAIVGGFGDVMGLTLLRVPVGPTLSAIPAIAGISWAWRQGWRPHRLALSFRRPTPLVTLLGGLAILLAVLSLGVALRHPPIGWDETGYHLPLAVFFWRDGTITDFLSRFPTSWALAQPGAAELFFGLLRVIGGEALMLLGQVPFALLGSAGILAFGRRLGLPRPLAWIGALGYLLTPMVALQIGRDANDIVGASMVIVCVALASAPRSEWSPSRVVLVGLSIGMMVVTKLALLPEALALGVVLLVVLWGFRRRRTDRDGPAAHLLTRDQALRGLGIALLVFVAVIGPWWIRNLIEYHNPVYPAALPGVGLGISQQASGIRDSDFVPRAYLWPLYPLFEPQDHNTGLGALYAIAILPGAVLGAIFARRRPLAILAFTVLISLPAWWVLTKHEPRFLLGLFGLSFALVPWVLLGVVKRWRVAVATLLALAAAGSAVVTITAPLSKYAVHPVDRVAFYQQLYRADPATLALPESQGLLLDDACTSYDRLYPFMGAAQARQVARLTCDPTTQQVLTALKTYGMRYVYATGSVSAVPKMDARYPAGQFQLVSESTAGPKGSRASIERRLYRVIPPGTPGPGITPTPLPSPSPSPLPTSILLPTPTALPSSSP